MLLTLVRDNQFVNWLGRNVLRTLLKARVPLGSLINRYRVYGTVTLNVLDVEFKVHSLADDFIANEIYYDQYHDQNEFRLLKELLKDAKHFVDAGANTGIFSIWAATSNSSLQVMSFEPHPANVARFRKNVSLNNSKNITTFPVALGQREAEIDFTIPRENQISAVGSANHDFTQHFHDFGDELNVGVARVIRVKQNTLDSALSGVTLTKHDVLKIDVEYYELEVLKGASHILTSIKPLILLEILDYDWLIEKFPPMEDKLDPQMGVKIQQWLAGFGYYMYRLDSQGIYFAEETTHRGGNRNFLFAPKRIGSNHLPYDRARELLLEHK